MKSSNLAVILTPRTQSVTRVLSMRYLFKQLFIVNITPYLRSMEAGTCTCNGFGNKIAIGCETEPKRHPSTYTGLKIST